MEISGDRPFLRTIRSRALRRSRFASALRRSGAPVPVRYRSDPCGPPAISSTLVWGRIHAPRGSRHGTTWLGAIVLTLLLILSGLAFLETAPRGGSEASPPAPFVPARSMVATPPSSPSVAPIVERAGPTFPSAIACALAPVPGCPALTDRAPLVPHPLASGPSSWLNLTPNPYPVSYPSARLGAEMTYDPGDSRTLLFGGLGNDYEFANDLWSFSAGNWTNLTAASPCSATSCPSPRAYAGFAYDLRNKEAVVFGGLGIVAGHLAALGDTWVDARGAWTNVTATAGTPPSPRFDASMSYTSAEGYVVLFGGSTINSTFLSDTWTFENGRWSNITANETDEPGARAGAAFGDSPTGYALLFGGYGPVGLIQPSTGTCGEFAQYWFSGGQWTHASISCVESPRGLTSANTTGEPCGREGAALAWSPKNQHFVLFGGDGIAGSGCNPTGTLVALNDTYLYLGSPGGAYDLWQSDISPGWPADREEMAYAPDYADGYVVIFGGTIGGGGLTNETWRYYAAVSALFTGPLVIENSATNLGFPIFTLTAFGGSGNLDFIFNTTGLQTGNPLTGSAGCSLFTDQAGHPAPTQGVDVIRCAPAPGAYNIYRLSVTVWDTEQTTARAYANWTFTADPPEALDLYSQFAGAFYNGISFTDRFSVYAQINNQPVTQITGSIGLGPNLSFSHTSSSDFWWNASYNMDEAPAGATLYVVVESDNWQENASLALNVVNTPSFITNFVNDPGVVQQEKSVGSGPFNENYSLTQSIAISLSAFSVTVPKSVPLLSGLFSLLPSMTVTFYESSAGTVMISGVLGESLPAIDLVGGSLTISASLNLSGTLSITNSNGVESIDWVTASLTVQIKGDFQASIPIYGYTFDLFGVPVTIGFSLTIDVAPTIALQMVMAPANSSATAIADGFNFTIVQLLGDFSLPITAAINFGVGVASVAVGGTLTFDVAFGIAPGPFGPTGLWINGTLFAMVQVLFWSATWNFLGPAVIYHSSPGQGEAPRSEGAQPATYDNGSDASWQLDPRSYNGTGYDRLLWSSLNSSGVAISDIYPHTSFAAASAYGGATLFYSNDQVDQPVRSGLAISGLQINASNNVATALPSPVDPGFIVTAPHSSAMPDGSDYVLWSALPTSQAGGPSPVGITTLALHGARYDPRNESWGPVHQFTASEIVQSSGIDTSGPSPTVVALVAPGLSPTPSSPEWLLSFNVTTGAEISNASVHGYATIVSVRGASGSIPGRAVLQLVAGNDSLLNLAEGSVQGVGYTPPDNSTLVEEQNVEGSATALLLRYRQTQLEIAVLYDPATSRTVAVLPLSGSVTDAEALASGGSFYVYVANGTGFSGWEVGPTGAVTPLLPVDVSGLNGFGMTQVGSSLLLYALVPEAGGAPGSRSLFLTEVGVGLPALTAGAPASSTGTSLPPAASSPSPFNWALWLGVPIVAAVVALTTIVILRRRPPTAPAAAPPSGATAPEAPLGPPPGPG
ncbi:MAG: hypothetical protein L3K03_00360 [Thermoplasmata archaeon]|nr:hypothetical protein [Thermoplasmata archaeon]